MREELLRFRNVDVAEDNRTLLRHINMYIMSGEKIGICGLHDSGKTALASALCGKMNLSGSVSRSPAFVQSHYISKQSTLVDDLLLYENLFLRRDSGDNRFFMNTAVLKRRTREILDFVGIDLPADAHLYQMDRVMRVVLQILKAYVEKTRMIILDGVTDAWRPDELKRLQDIIDRFPEICFVYVCNGTDSILSCCDRVFIMRARKIAAILERDNYTEKQLEAYEFGRYVTGVFQRERVRQIGRVILEIRLTGEREEISLEVREGEIVGIIDTGPQDQINFYEGNFEQMTRSVQVCGKRYDRMEDAIGKDLQLMDMYEPNRQLFSCFSREENIRFPILKRLSALSLLFPRTEVFIKKELDQFPGVSKESEETDTDALHIALQRLWLAEPKAAIVNYAPSGYHPDERMAAIRVFNSLADKGVGLLLILSDLESGNEVCDRIVRWNRKG